jgi:hypothetical protein
VQWYGGLCPGSEALPIRPQPTRAPSLHPTPHPHPRARSRLRPRSTEGARKKPPIYKVMLHNDNYNRREYVVKVLLKVVEGMTVDDAVVVMQVGRARARRAFGDSLLRHSAAAPAVVVLM